MAIPRHCECGAAVTDTDGDWLACANGHYWRTHCGLTEHDAFARCPECGRATVGLRKPYAINHAAGCSMPEPPPTRGAVADNAPALAFLSSLIESMRDTSDDEARAAWGNEALKILYHPRGAVDPSELADLLDDALRQMETAHKGNLAPALDARVKIEEVRRRLTDLPRGAV